METFRIKRRVDQESHHLELCEMYILTILETRGGRSVVAGYLRRTDAAGRRASAPPELCGPTTGALPEERARDSVSVRVSLAHVHDAVAPRYDVDCPKMLAEQALQDAIRAIRDGRPADAPAWASRRFAQSSRSYPHMHL